MGQYQSKEPDNYQQLKQQQQQQRQQCHQSEVSDKANSSSPTTPTPAPEPEQNPPISEISRPRAPSTLTRLSSLLDPISPVVLPPSPTGSNRWNWNENGTYGSSNRRYTSSGTATNRASQKNPLTIRSPSGNLLGMASYFERPDRPLSMRERQERVRRAMERAQGGESRLGGESDNSDGSIREQEKTGHSGSEKESQKRKKSRQWHGFCRKTKRCCCFY